MLIGSSLEKKFNLSLTTHVRYQIRCYPALKKSACERCNNLKIANGKSNGNNSFSYLTPKNKKARKQNTFKMMGTRLGTEIVP